MFVKVRTIIKTQNGSIRRGNLICEIWAAIDIGMTSMPNYSSLPFTYFRKMNSSQLLQTF